MLNVIWLQESPIFQLQVTFTAMQHSALGAFNPVKLVESLKLRASEQQDAQEYVAPRLVRERLLRSCLVRFSKLFMAHLDNEFKQQQNSELKSLIPDQVNRLLQAPLSKC